MDTLFINLYDTQGNETDTSICLSAETHHAVSWCEGQPPKPWALVTCESIREGELVPQDRCWVGLRHAGNFGRGTKKLLSAFADIVEPIWCDGQNA